MSEDDPRHGTDAGYWTHRRSRERACQSCRAAHHRANVAVEEESAELTGGRWVPKGLVQVWQPRDDEAVA